MLQQGLSCVAERARWFDGCQKEYCTDLESMQTDGVYNLSLFACLYSFTPLPVKLSLKEAALFKLCLPVVYTE